MPKALFRILFSVLTLAVLATGCKKNDIIIDDNTAPPDSTVSTLLVENYVTKCYISLVGREPSEQEETTAIATLKSDNLSIASRKFVLNTIVANVEYRTKVLEFNSIKLLNGLLDVAALQGQIDNYIFLQQQPEYANLYDEIQAVIDNLILLRDSPAAFVNGEFGMEEMHRRLVSNDIYDQINMGSFNFVLSMFNNFLFRDPTGDEHDAGITMVDGFVAVVFFETANSKEEFTDIFLHSDDYYEGQVRELYFRYLFREPTSEEQSYHSVRYKESSNYERLQIDILSTDEFAGL
ncbi:MAG: hypothetical protein ACJAYA_000911 [Bacteroidia bacterium]|jgi:hypothetical protein